MRAKLSICLAFIVLLAVLAISPVSASAGRPALGRAVAVEQPTASAPQPQPQSQPTQATAETFFSGRTASDFEVDHSAPGAISETRGLVPATARVGGGSSVIAMTVNNADVYPITPTENPRAELVSPPIVKPGEEVWLHTRFMVPTDYPAVSEGGWVSLVSFYGAPFNGPSPWHLELCGERLQWQRNGDYSWDIPYEAPLVRGKWTDVLVHEKLSGEGFIEMWIDGQQIDFFTSGGFNPDHEAPTDRLEMATSDASNGAGANAAKIMQYRDAGMFETGTIYFEGLELGPTRASVGG
jgi:hypothetical protein